MVIYIGQLALYCCDLNHLYLLIWRILIHLYIYVITFFWSNKRNGEMHISEGFTYKNCLIVSKSHVFYGRIVFI